MGRLDKGAESRVFGFEGGQAIAQRGEGWFELRERVARRDVLWAVPVEGFDTDEQGAFDNCRRVGRAEGLEQSRCLRVVFMDFDAAEDLQPGLVRVIHEEEGDPGVVLEVAERYVLLVAAEVGEADQLRVDDVDETRGAAAMLDIRPASLAD